MKKFTAFLALLFLAPSIAKADIDDTFYFKCSKNVGACGVAAHYYSNKVSKSLSEDDKCHVGFAMAATEFLWAYSNNNAPNMADAHGVISVTRDQCPDPWKTKARMLMNQMDKVIDSM